MIYRTRLRPGSFCFVSVSCWSSCFGMYSARNSLKAELQQVSPKKQKTLRSRRRLFISSWQAAFIRGKNPPRNYGIRSRHRAGNPRPAQNQIEDVVRLRQRNSARAPNTHVCPVCLGLPGVLPVANEEALRLTVLTGFLLNCEIPALRQVRPEELFLSGHAEELPDHAIRQAVHGATASWSLNSTAAFPACASPARIWRRTWARTSISSATAAWISTAPACRSGNRFRAGHHQRRHGLRISQRAQGHSGLRRRERLRHGKGHGALRRERQRAARGHQGTRRENRNQEHEQLFRRAPRAGIRNPAPD